MCTTVQSWYHNQNRYKSCQDSSLSGLSTYISAHKGMLNGEHNYSKIIIKKRASETNCTVIFIHKYSPDQDAKLKAPTIFKNIPIEALIKCLKDHQIKTMNITVFNDNEVSLPQQVDESFGFIRQDRNGQDKRGRSIERSSISLRSKSAPPMNKEYAIKKTILEQIDKQEDTDFVSKQLMRAIRANLLEFYGSNHDVIFQGVKIDPLNKKLLIDISNNLSWLKFGFAKRIPPSQDEEISPEQIKSNQMNIEYPIVFQKPIRNESREFRSIDIYQKTKHDPFQLEEPKKIGCIEISCKEEKNFKGELVSPKIEASINKAVKKAFVSLLEPLKLGK